MHPVCRSAYILSFAFLTVAGMVGTSRCETDSKTIGQLVADLSHSDSTVRIRAIGDLAQRGTAARPALRDLIRALQAPEGEVRRAAIIALGQLQLEPDVTIPALIQAMADPTPVYGIPLNAVAGFAAGQFGKPAVPYLIEALGSKDLHVRHGALAGIYRAGPLAKDAVDDLITMLEQNDPQTRKHVLNCMIGIGPEARRAVPAVTQCLACDDFHTQYWACRALAAIGPDAQPATGELIHWLTAGVASVRRNAAMALGQIGPGVGPEAVRALIRALDDYSQPVKQNAVVALGELCPLSNSAAPVIERLLREPAHFSPRANAAKTLWLLRPDSETLGVDALLQDLLTGSEPWLAAELLAEIDFHSDVVARIVPLLDSDRRGIREYACIALGNFGADAAGVQRDLEPLLQDRAEEVRQAAAEALRKIDQPPRAPSPERQQRKP